MRIGFDASDLHTNRADGTTRYTYEILKRLPTYLPGDEWLAFAPGPRASQFPLPDSIHWQASLWPKFWTQSRLPFDLFRYRPNVLFMPIQQLPILRPWGMKTVAVVHDLAFHQFGPQYTWKDWFLLHVFTAQVVQRADHIIAISRSTAADIAHFYGRTHNVHIVPHGVSPTFRPPNQGEHVATWQQIHEAFPKLKKPYILTVGQIQPRKNLTRLIEAFEQLTRNHAYAGHQLVIAGAHGWMQDPILQRIKTSERAASIHMLGRVDDKVLLPLYWHAEVFALVSLYEGFGLPLLEAMAAGTPVVTSAISSMPEVVGDAGILINPKQPGSIREGIVKALQQKDTLRQQGIDQARKFSWDAAAQTVANLLKQEG